MFCKTNETVFKSCDFSNLDEDVNEASAKKNSDWKESQTNKVYQHHFTFLEHTYRTIYFSRQM